MGGGWGLVARGGPGGAGYKGGQGGKGRLLGALVGLNVFLLALGQAVLAPDLLLLVRGHRVVHDGVHHGLGEGAVLTSKCSSLEWKEKENMTG